MMSHVFLILLTAHLGGDFVLQTAAQASGKRAGQPKAYLQHGATHWITSALLLLVFAPELVGRWRTFAILLLLIAGHLALDACKERMGLRWPARSVLVFLADQIAHVLLLLLVAGAISRTFPLSVFPTISAWLVLHREALLVTAAIYLTVVFGCGYLIQLALTPFRAEPGAATPEPDEAAATPGDERRPGMRNAGMYIGWLERAIILTAIAAGAPTLVGLVIAAKAIIRFGEGQTAFAEYFLLGTFLSLLLAGAGAFLLQALVRPLPFPQ